MYYPKSQVKTNLYTNGGDLIALNSTTPYKGYYYETSDGRYFSGRTPNESPTFELVKVNQNEPTTNLPPSLQIEDIPLDNLYIIENGYANSTRLNFNQNAPSPPKQSYPVLTENDYKLGEFQRYFLKKGNESQFIEISLEDYRKYVSQDRDVMFELYVPIQINWIITGDKEQVYKVNQSIVARAEREQNLPGFIQYFKDKFTQFYQSLDITTVGSISVNPPTSINRSVSVNRPILTSRSTSTSRPVFVSRSIPVTSSINFASPSSQQPFRPVVQNTSSLAPYPTILSGGSFNSTGTQGPPGPPGPQGPQGIPGSTPVGQVTGEGNTNYVAKYTSDGTTIGNSQIFDNGTNVGIGTITPSDYGSRLSIVTQNTANFPSLVLFKNISSSSTEDIFRVQSWNGALNTVASIKANGSALFSNNLEALTIVKTGGTSSQFLMADGSVNTNVLASGAYLPLAGGILTGTTRMDGSGGTVPSITMIYNSGVNRLLAPILRLYGATNESSNYVELFGALATQNRTINFPDASGTVALTSQIPANPVGGTGNLNYISKFTSDGSTIGNSQIFDNGTNVGINNNNPLARLQITTAASTSAIRISEGSHDGSSSTFSYTPLSYWARADNIQRTSTNPLATGGSTAAIVFTDRPGTQTFQNQVRTSDIQFWTATNFDGVNLGQYPALRMSITAEGNVIVGGTTINSTQVSSTNLYGKLGGWYNAGVVAKDVPANNTAIITIDGGSDINISDIDIRVSLNGNSSLNAQFGYYHISCDGSGAVYSPTISQYYNESGGSFQVSTSDFAVSFSGNDIMITYTNQQYSMNTIIFYVKGLYNSISIA